MKATFYKILFLIFISFWVSQIQAQEDVTIVAPTVEAAEGLDLQAVAELFKEASNLEEFERALNDPDQLVNNLDLDENGEVDFIRVVEEVSGETHIIILQALLGEDEIQDVATIEIEKADDNYNMQLSGDEDLYGPHYYIVPNHRHLERWGIISWLYRPVYRPYYSKYRFGYWPKWHRTYRPVKHKIYRARTVKYVNRKGFVVSKTRKVKVVKVKHQRRSATVVKKRTVPTGDGQKMNKAKNVKKKRTIKRDRRK